MILDPVPEYFFKQSGVIPYRFDGKKLKIMLITSRRKQKWIIPKGVIEPYMTPQQSAAQEAYEEAGVFGKVWTMPVGSYKMEKWGGTCNVMVFPMLVTKIYDDWMEGNFRKRKWMSPEKAMKKIARRDVAELIEKFVEDYEANSLG